MIEEKRKAKDERTIKVFEKEKIQVLKVRMALISNKV